MRIGAGNSPRRHDFFFLSLCKLSEGGRYRAAMLCRLARTREEKVAEDA